MGVLAMLKLFPRFEMKVREIRDRMKLALVKTSPCIADNLRSLKKSELEDIFASKAIERDWNQDKNEIENLNLPEANDGICAGDQRALYYLVQSLKPKTFLEIGTHIGCSSVNIALALKRISNGGSSFPAKLTTVDIRDVNDPVTKPWLKFQSKNSPAENLKKIGCDGFTNFVQADSLEFLANCATNFDFIFLDGLHSGNKVYQEIPLALKRLNREGVILLHDFYPYCQSLIPGNIVITGPYLATNRLLKEGAGFAVCPLGHLPWPTKQGSYFTTLAILHK
jgi:predicted O-methyltransferase YrrM